MFPVRRLSPQIVADAEREEVVHLVTPARQAGADGLVPHLEPDDVAAALARNLIAVDVPVGSVQRQVRHTGVAHRVQPAQIQDRQDADRGRRNYASRGARGGAPHTRIADARRADERAAHPRRRAGAGQGGSEGAMANDCGTWVDQ